MKFIAIQTELKKALAATCFINLAKMKLKVAVHVPAIEEQIQKTAADYANELELNADALKSFMDIYCQVSRTIQTHMRTNNEHPLSTDEKKALESLKIAIPVLAEVNTIEDIQSYLAKDEGEQIAKEILGWARQLISESNIEIFHLIKNAPAITSDEDTEELNFGFSSLISTLFVDEAIVVGLGDLIKQWVASLIKVNQVNCDSVNSCAI